MTAPPARLRERGGLLDPVAARPGSWPGVRRPLLLLSADDDPLVPARSTAGRGRPGRNPAVTLEVTSGGGHVAFVSGTPLCAPPSGPRSGPSTFLPACLDGRAPDQGTSSTFPTFPRPCSRWWARAGLLEREGGVDAGPDPPLAEERRARPSISPSTISGSPQRWPMFTPATPRLSLHERERREAGDREELPRRHEERTGAARAPCWRSRR